MYIWCSELVRGNFIYIFACFFSHCSFQLILWWKRFGATAAGLIRWIHPDVCAEDCGGCSTHWPAGWGPAHLWRGGGSGEWLESVLFCHVVMVLSKINWLFLVWFFFFFCSLGTSWSLSKSICPNPLTGKEMALHHLWCQTKPDSEISREFWTYRQNIKTITFLKSLHICFWLLYLIHQAFAAQIVWYRTRIRGGQRKSLNFIYRPKLSKNIQMKFW